MDGSENFIACSSCTTNGLGPMVGCVGGCDKEQERQWFEDKHVLKWERPRTYLIIKNKIKTRLQSNLDWAKSLC